MLRAVESRLDTAIAAERDPVSIFNEALILAESALKVAVAGLVAGIRDDRDRWRYRYEYQLVRAAGIGEWAYVLQGITSGPAYGLLADPFQRAVNELNRNFASGSSSWQCTATEQALDALRVVQADASANAKVRASQWADFVTRLRNRTRGHGALTQQKADLMWPPLDASIRTFIDGFSLFQTEWAFLHRNNSGKFRVVPLANGAPAFDFLKSSTHYSFQDGLYIAADDGNPVPVRLVVTDMDLSDFWIANGNYNDRNGAAEWFSYATDTQQCRSAGEWQQIPASLPSSETNGSTALDVQGEVFGNLPPVPDGYVQRPTLESELKARLKKSDWHRIVTLVGPGGAGKTSVTLTVLHQLTQESTYEAMLWFSSRDVDLTERGPIPVKPKVTTLKDVGKVLWSFLESGGVPHSFDAEGYLGEQLSRSSLGACLFVFDNFETIENPVAVYEWLNAHVGPENKVLITTRLRSFRGDYPVEVGGMTRPEFDELVSATGKRLSIADRLPIGRVDQLFTMSDGHPYVTKLLLGHIAMVGDRGLNGLIANREDVLQALFERSFKQVTPLAQRAFMTLCGWRSAVPRLAIEAILTYSASASEIPDTGDAIDQLANYSLIELILGPDDSAFARVPNIARHFGQKKLEISYSQELIKNDIELLQLFGPMQESEASRGYRPRIERFLSAVGERINSTGDLNQWKPLLESVARSFPEAWLRLAELERSQGCPESALGSCGKYLEVFPDDPSGWDTSALLARSSGDFLGEAHALIRHARLSGSDRWELFHDVGRLNELMQDIRSLMARDEREALYGSMLRLFDGIGDDELNPTQLSRLAWLAIHAGEKDRGRAYAATLERIDPTSRFLPGLRNIY